MVATYAAYHDYVLSIPDGKSALKGSRLKQAWSYLLLRRTYDSSLPANSDNTISKALPLLSKYVLNIGATGASTRLQPSPRGPPSAPPGRGTHRLILHERRIGSCSSFSSEEMMVPEEEGESESSTFSSLREGRLFYQNLVSDKVPMG
jgi:hypothetical protein